jgi:hypothetical protein
MISDALLTPQKRYLTPLFLAEDYSFCYRARQCGFRIMADTTIRLLHVGTYAYRWEDAGGGRPQRQGNYRYQITD